MDTDQHNASIPQNTQLPLMQPPNSAHNSPASLLTPSSVGLLPQHLEKPPRTLEPSHPSSADRRELEQFAKTFKQRRKELPGDLSNPLTTPKTMGRQQKKRTLIVPSVRAALEKVFLQNPYPTYMEYLKLAETMHMDEKVVRVWFQNRRQKQKRIIPPWRPWEHPAHRAAPCSLSPNRWPLLPATSDSHVHNSSNPALLVNQELSHANLLLLQHRPLPRVPIPM